MCDQRTKSTTNKWAYIFFAFRISCRPTSKKRTEYLETAKEEGHKEGLRTSSAKSTTKTGKTKNWEPPQNDATLAAIQEISGLGEELDDEDADETDYEEEEEEEGDYEYDGLYYNEDEDDEKSGSSGSEDDNEIDYAEWAERNAAQDSTESSGERPALSPHGPSSYDFPADMPFIEAIATCTTLECLRDAHKQPHGPAKFNFPHFMVIGFQKAATTSLYGYFQPHPQSLNPKTKEPEFLTFGCNYHPPEECPAAATKKYIHETLRLKDFVASNGSRAAFEASTHIVRTGDVLAPRMLELMPWLKVIVLLREPISRAASMLIHIKDVSKEGCLLHGSLGDCLLNESQIQGAPSGARATNYSFPMQQWLEVWPKDQIHVIQYEELIEDARNEAELLRVKKFVGVDLTKELEGLRRRNARRFKIKPKGWPMKQTQYQELIDLVKPDVEELVDLLEAHGQLESTQKWKDRWQAVWDENLDSCDKKGRCNIQLS